LDIQNTNHQLKSGMQKNKNNLLPFTEVLYQTELPSPYFLGEKERNRTSASSDIEKDKSAFRIINLLGAN
jgi:hypothetical protein